MYTHAEVGYIPGTTRSTNLRKDRNLMKFNIDKEYNMTEEEKVKELED